MDSVSQLLVLPLLLHSQLPCYPDINELSTSTSYSFPSTGDNTPLPPRDSPTAPQACVVPTIQAAQLPPIPDTHDPSLSLRTWLIPFIARAIPTHSVSQLLVLPLPSIFRYSANELSISTSYSLPATGDIASLTPCSTPPSPFPATVLP
jgi:hypothetical protein